MFVCVTQRLLAVRRQALSVLGNVMDTRRLERFAPTSQRRRLSAFSELLYDSYYSELILVASRPSEPAMNYSIEDDFSL